MKKNNTFLLVKDKNYFLLLVYLYIFLMPWNFFKSQMGVFTVILFLFWLIKFKTELKKRLSFIFQSKPLSLLIAFTVFTYVSALWSGNIEEGLKYVNSFHKYYFLLIPILYCSLNENEAKNSLKVLLLSFFSYSLFSICIYLGWFSIHETGSDINNPKGIMGYAIVTQYMAIGTIGLFIMSLFENNKTYKYMFLTFSMICLFALLVNNSRTAQIALVLALLTIMVLYYGKKIFNLKYILYASCCTTILIVSIFFLLHSFNKLDRFQKAYNELAKVVYEDKYEGSFGLRVYFNKVGLEAVKERPILGFGPENNVKYLINYQENDPNYTYEKTFSTYHSEHFDLLTRYGLVGYLLLISSIVLLLKMLKAYDIKYYLIGLTFYIPIFYISLANATFAKKPINYILITVFILLCIILDKSKKRADNDLLK